MIIGHGIISEQLDILVRSGKSTRFAPNSRRPHDGMRNESL